jgi:purine-cytosine permease-like protein
MTVSSFLARTVPVIAMLLALAAFGNVGGMVALLAILVGLVAWASAHTTPDAVLEYDFAD